MSEEVRDNYYGDCLRGDVLADILLCHDVCNHMYKALAYYFSFTYAAHVLKNQNVGSESTHPLGGYLIT